MNYLANYLALERLNDSLVDSHAADGRRRWLRYWWSRRTLENGEPFAAKPPRSARPLQHADKAEWAR